LQDYYQALVSGERRGLAAGLQRFGLRLAGLPYSLGVALRNRLFDCGWKGAERAAVPVISVGNLTAGGTGKTPCVEYVVRRLREWGRNVAILSRGYGVSTGPNDEARMLAENLPGVPHLQGADRVALARRAVAELRSDVLVLDDGFQHRRLARDLDLVLLDATRPWGFGYLLPRGLLRESPEALKRAGAVLLTRCDQARDLDRLRSQVTRLAPRAPLIETEHRPSDWLNAASATRPLEDFQGRDVVAFCGLGNPDAFRRTLLDVGLAVRAFRAFPDHHAYTPEDVEALSTWARKEAPGGVVVTTQKDLVKLRLTRLGTCELWALRIQLRIVAGQDEFDRKLKEALG
jgi:tetraacyldisaccharide 4'-kinase